MGDEEWMSCLRRFASTGVWPSEAGNRPAPRQKKWFDLFQRIDKCPMQVRGQATLFGGPQKCLCGFHPSKLAAPSYQSAFSQPSAHSSQSAAPSSQSSAFSEPATAASSQLAAHSSQSAAASPLSQPSAHSSQSAAPSSQSSAFSQPATAASSSQPTTSTVQYAPGSPTQVPGELLAVDDQNIPGMDRVDRLAEYLVELRTSTGLTLSRQQPAGEKLLFSSPVIPVRMIPL
ncbi:hypothetical protein DPX16_21573 [Anabarilius grahami]|uniref:Uncharacterized protein n=1 Tax=Anabarilius grahami TaxID=495550 RepID=A0A3N0XH82_ANAGA|nr:hypothetical protein DPX16_21573 [Anabarilius grahami]